MRNTEALVFASKKNGLEASAEKAMYMVMIWEQNAGRSHYVKTDNRSFIGVKQFKYLVTT